MMFGRKDAYGGCPECGSYMFKERSVIRPYNIQWRCSKCGKLIRPVEEEELKKLQSSASEATEHE